MGQRGPTSCRAEETDRKAAWGRVPKYRARQIQGRDCCRARALGATGAFRSQWRLCHTAHALNPTSPQASQRGVSLYTNFTSIKNAPKVGENPEQKYLALRNNK